jgi:hypothetical protein
VRRVASLFEHPEAVDMVDAAPCPCTRQPGDDDVPLERPRCAPCAEEAEAEALSTMTTVGAVVAPVVEWDEAA